MKRLILLTLIGVLLFTIKGICQPQIYTSYNLPNQNWEDNSTWTKSEVWMADNPGTALNSTSVNVNGTVTRTGSLSNGGSTVLNVNGTLNITGDLSNNSVINVASSGSIILDGNYSNTGASTLDIYGTVIVKGNLTTSTNIHVHPGGLLIVLGDLTVTNAGAAAIVNEGNVVAVGQFSTAGDITTGDSFYIFDDVPSYNWGATVDGTNWNGGGNSGTLTNEFPTEGDIPTWLNDILAGLGVTCGGINTIGSAQTTCSASAPATLTGTAISGATYTWESSTTSALSGFSTAAGASGNQNYSPAALSQTTWFRRRVTNGACSATSAAIQITIFSGSVWTGTSSTAWATAGNWCGGVPTTTTDALVPVVSSNYPSVSSAANCRNLTILSGASVTVSSNTLSIYGDFSNAGTLTVNGTALFIGAANQTIANTGTIAATGNNTSTISFNGSAQQTLSSTTAITTNILVINNASSGQVIFQTNVNANRGLTMTAGIVNLSGNTVKLGTSSANGAGGIGTYTGGAARFINGSFERWIRNAVITEANAVLFPMGSATGTRPISIWTTAASGTGSLIVSHTENNTTTTGLSIADGGTINRRQNSYWTITAGNSLSGGTYSMKAGGTGFGTVTNLAHLRLMRLSDVTGTNALATGSLTDFLARRTAVSLANLQSNFYIGSIDNSSPLPITLFSFTAQESAGGIQLEWVTTMEKNFDRFELERATSDLEFTSITTIQGKGGLDIKTSYEFLDTNPARGKNYYRLKSIDFDNTFEYSPVIVADWDGISDGISLYPNPVTNRSFTLELKDVLSIPVTVKVIESRGYIVYETEITGQTSTVNLPENIGAGIYVIKISSAHGQQVIRVVVAE